MTHGGASPELRIQCRRVVGFAREEIEPVASPSRQFLADHPEIGVVALLALLLGTIFAATPLDRSVAALFFDPQTMSWPLASVPWIDFLNRHLIDYFSAFGAVVGIACLVRGSWPRSDRLWRRVGVFLLLSLAIGPGLLVNGFFKSEWGRPRPADILEFGGRHEFRPPHDPGAGGPPEAGGAGRSFPSGHAAVAFWSSAVFFVGRFAFSRYCGAALAATLAFGLLAGFARIAAGRHFLSDILWAGLLVFTVNWIIAYLIVRLPRGPQQRTGIAA